MTIRLEEGVGAGGEGLSVASALPQTGLELYQFLKKADVESKARVKFPEITRTVDQAYSSQRATYLQSPTKENLTKLASAIGFAGAFNFIEDMQPICKDGTVDGTIFPFVKLGPPAAVQVLEIAKITATDNVLELFSGVGYFTFFLALSSPQVLDCVDLYSCQTHDLESTFTNAYASIFSELSEIVRPTVTKPGFIQADCEALPNFEQDASFQHHYNKVLLHPPYGRESRKIVDLSEAQAFTLWLKSLASLSKANGQGAFQTYSTVPSEWAETVIQSMRDQQVDCAGTIRVLKDKLGISSQGVTAEESIAESQWANLLPLFATAQAHTIKSRKIGISVLTTEAA